MLGSLVICSSSPRHTVATFNSKRKLCLNWKKKRKLEQLEQSQLQVLINGVQRTDPGADPFSGTVSTHGPGAELRGRASVCRGRGRGAPRRDRSVVWELEAHIYTPHFNWSRQFDACCVSQCFPMSLGSVTLVPPRPDLQRTQKYPVQFAVRHG